MSSSLKNCNIIVPTRSIANVVFLENETVIHCADGGTVSINTTRSVASRMQEFANRIESGDVFVTRPDGNGGAQSYFTPTLATLFTRTFISTTAMFVGMWGGWAAMGALASIRKK